MDPRGYTTDETARLAGVTYRQLDYWARNGQLTPSNQEADGSGSQRFYSPADVIAARTFGRLHALGINPKRSNEPLPSGPAELIAHLIVELEVLAELNGADRESADRRPARRSRRRADTHA